MPSAFGTLPDVGRGTHCPALEATVRAIIGVPKHKYPGRPSALGARVEVLGGLAQEDAQPVAVSGPEPAHVPARAFRASTACERSPHWPCSSITQVRCSGARITASSPTGCSAGSGPRVLRCRRVLRHLRVPALPALRARGARWQAGPATLAVLETAVLSDLSRVLARFAVVVFILGQSTFASVGQAITAFGLLENYRYGYSPGLAVAWTLVIEVSFYLVLPVLAWLIRSVSDRSPIAGSSFESTWSRWRCSGSGFRRRAPSTTSKRRSGRRPADVVLAELGETSVVLVSRLVALGMALAVGSVWLALGGRVPRVVAVPGTRAGLSWLLALECYWIVVRLRLASSPMAPRLRPRNRSCVGRSWGLCGFVVLPAVFGPQGRGRIRRVLRARIAVMLGVVSYGIYLWHVPSGSRP